MILLIGFAVAGITLIKNDKEISLTKEEISNLKTWYNVTDLTLDTSDYERDGKFRRYYKGWVTGCTPRLDNETALDDWMIQHIKDLAIASKVSLERETQIKIKYGNTTIS